MYGCRKFPHMLPFAVFLAATLIAGMGAGFYTVLAFMAPIALLMCDKTGMGKMVGAMAVNYGALAGANFMASQSGLIFRGLMQSAGVSAIRLSSIHSEFSPARWWSRWWFSVSWCSLPITKKA